MSTFCRITGKSRGLPKPNYFPILPPISPADAKRFCRITGKSYGLPSHHFIPVVLVSKSKKARKMCKITNNEAAHKFTPEVETRDKRRRHNVLIDYRYIVPVLNGTSDQQKKMMELLSTKDGKAVSFPDEDAQFVYAVEERRCNLVFSSNLEAAVRDGDVRDVMLAKESDTVVFKLKQGTEISLDFQNVVPKVNKNSEFYEGEGPNADVIKEMEEKAIKKRKRKRPENLGSVKKIFEEKEKEAEKEVEKEIELTELKKAKVAEANTKAESKEAIERKVELHDDDTMTEEEEKAILNNWRRFDPRHSRAETSLVMCTGDWRDLIKPLIEEWDWDSWEKDSNMDAAKPVITVLPKPIPIQAEIIDLGEASPGIVQSQNLGAPEDTAGLEPIPSVAPFKPLLAEPVKEVQQALSKLRDPEILAKTSNVKNALSSGDEKIKSLIPKVNEIPELISRIESGVITEIEGKGNKVQGLVIDIESAQRFVAGQEVQTPSGPVFVPGQTLLTPSGLTFVPGFTVKTPGSDSPVLIPGQKVLAITEESGGNVIPVFVAGQTLSTRDGDKFVAGQTVHTADGPKFMPGQTVITPDGPKFIPGQLVSGKRATNTVNESATDSKDINVSKGSEVNISGETINNNIPPDYKFVPGQTVMTSDGPKFVPGQTVATAQGEEIFIAGQSVETQEGNWEFVPGQTIKKDGEVKFVPGQTVMTPDGPKFIPGRIANTEDGSPQFVPGITVEEKDGAQSKFVPGKTIQTSEGTKFVEGQLIKSVDGGTTFVPGKTDISEGSIIKFAAAKKLGDIIMGEAIDVPEEGLKPINPTSFAAPSSHMPTSFGHVVQTSHGVEFFPGRETSGLPAGKIVPGKLERSVDGKVKFVPGTIIETDPGIKKFVPGQVVMTRQGEQFIPGQVVETSDGAKFVPGQIVETRTGQKFVPGQTMDTADGTKFVPGQIVDTSAGPTFIPGQVITTEEGSKFVPGEVVDTFEGPRFVPGTVVETEDNEVKFVPGQIVQTKEGKLHFVAPDLQDTPEGDFEFSVQGFEITPEELQILRPIHVTPSYIPTSGCEMSIDSHMLRQLSEAGMSLGRQVSLDIPTVNVKREVVIREVRRNLHEAKVNKIEILKDIFSEHHTEESILEKLSAVLKHNIEISNEKESRKLSAREDTLESAFKHLSHGNPDFVEQVLQKLSEHVEELDTERGAMQSLQRAIVSVVQERSEQRIREMLKDDGTSDAIENDGSYREDTDQGGSKGLLLQAVGLARALGMSDVVSGLLDVLSDPQSTQLLANDRFTMDILRRLTVMRQLAEQRPSLCHALRQLQNDPEIARSDPRLRELVRESAVLMVVPEEEDNLPLASSKDIPSVLFHSNNILAMEDFLYSRNQRSTGTLLIIKRGLQAIIPRENARGVLTGQIPYTVLDETGIRHFEPLHVFSALRLPRQAAHHWTIYSCPVAKEERTTTNTTTACTITSGSSCEDLGVMDSYRNFSDTSTTSRRRGTLDSVDGSTLNYTRLNGDDDTTQSVTSGYNTPTAKYESHSSRINGTLESNDNSPVNYSRVNGDGSVTPPSGRTTPNSKTYGSYRGDEEIRPRYRWRSYSTPRNYKKLTNGLVNGLSDHDRDIWSDKGGKTSGTEVFDVFVATDNFTADDVDAISLKKGDVVEVLDSGPESVK